MGVDNQAYDGNQNIVGRAEEIELVGCNPE